MIITRFWYPIDFLDRYDFLFLAAVAFQVLLLSFRLESPREAVVILIFHIVATVMELFKTSDGIRSWQYPEPFLIGIGNVPLFAGFMYSAVGSYIARVWRIFDFRYSHYPPMWSTVVLVTLIYINFFSHHYVYDIRWLLIFASMLMFGESEHLFQNGHRASPHASHYWLVTGGSVYLVCRKSGDLFPYLDLSHSGKAVANGAPLQIDRLVSVDDAQFRAGVARQSSHSVQRRSGAGFKFILSIFAALLINQLQLNFIFRLGNIHNQRRTAWVGIFYRNRTFHRNTL